MVRRSALPGYIVDVLRERFPGRVVPHGTWKLLSEELGISRIYIGSVAARKGWQVEDRRETRPVADVKEAIPDCLKQLPCAEVPFGLYVSLAQDLDVSRQ